jgi:hypothetical protein
MVGARQEARADTLPVRDPSGWAVVDGELEATVLMATDLDVRPIPS